MRKNPPKNILNIKNKLCKVLYITTLLNVPHLVKETCVSWTLGIGYHLYHKSPS